MSRSDERLAGIYAARRLGMVEHVRAHSLASGIALSESVLDVIGRIPRERFLPRVARAHAYDDKAQPIGLGQTVSQPSIVAWMSTLLNLTGCENILEVGAGSGYQTLIVASLVPYGRVVSMERLPMHARRAYRRLRALGCTNARVVVGDGSLGHPSGAPYDRIVVTAAAPQPSQALMDQLGAGGRMVAPVGTLATQELLTIDKSSSGDFILVSHGRCAFVPLVGAEGWNGDDLD